MNWRRRQLQENQSRDMRWTILPPQFYDNLIDSCNKTAVNFANGKLSPFPSILNVDYVFFPLFIGNHEWTLVRIDLRTQEMMMYWLEKIDSSKYRQSLHPMVTKISVYFTGLLVNLQYWKKSGCAERSLILEVNEDYIKSHRDLVGNHGVYLCMLMEHLVTGKPIQSTDDFSSACASYRRFMADNFYFWRCLPRPC